MAAAYLGSDALTRRGTSRKNLTDSFQVKKSYLFKKSGLTFSPIYQRETFGKSVVVVSFLRNADNKSRGDK